MTGIGVKALFIFSRSVEDVVANALPPRSLRVQKVVSDWLWQGRREKLGVPSWGNWKWRRHPTNNLLIQTKMTCSSSSETWLSIHTVTWIVSIVHAASVKKFYTFWSNGLEISSTVVQKWSLYNIGWNTALQTMTEWSLKTGLWIQVVILTQVSLYKVMVDRALAS